MEMDLQLISLALVAIIIIVILLFCFMSTLKERSFEEVCADLYCWLMQSLRLLFFYILFHFPLETAI